MGKSILEPLSANYTDTSLSPDRCIPKGIINEARQLIANNEAQCIVIKNGVISAKYTGKGVGPLLKIHRNHPEAMKGGVIVDKVIGRAAAFIMINGGVSSAYGLLISESAKVLLEEHKINLEYDKIVPEILNREHTDLCPLERCVLGEKDPTVALDKTYKQIDILMKNKTKNNL